MQISSTLLSCALQNKHMKHHKLKVISIAKASSDMLKVVTEFPQQYTFLPGQATALSLQKITTGNASSPLIGSNNGRKDHNGLQINICASAKGETEHALAEQKDGSLLLDDIFGAVRYKGEDIFIAGGAGTLQLVAVFKYFKIRSEESIEHLLYKDVHAEKNALKSVASEVMNGDYDSNTEIQDPLSSTVEGKKKHKTFYVCASPEVLEATVAKLANL